MNVNGDEFRLNKEEVFNLLFPNNLQCLREQQDANIEVKESIRNVFNDVVQKMSADLHSIKEEENVDENVTSCDLAIFMRQTLSALADDIEMGSDVYITHDDFYFWTNYFFLHYCGMHLFLTNLQVMLEKLNNAETVADIILNLIDECVENGDYLNPDSDVPEKFAKNILWQIIKSNIDEESDIEAYIDEIMLELIEKVNLAAEEKERLSADLQETTQLGDVRCKEFLGIDVIAEQFVENILRDAVDFIEENTSEMIYTKYYIEAKPKPAHYVHIDTPTIAAFSAQIGEKYIDAYIKTWVCVEAWKYSINFLMAQSDACSDYYQYEVIWCIPTNLYPIAQATASVFFRIEVSRVKPIQCLVDMTYKFEGNSLTRTPFQYAFDEQLLFYILDSKIALYKSLEF